jgi:uncharacterized protein (DUF1330 family)
MYVDPNRDSFRAWMAGDLTAPVVMLNLLRFRDQADYSGAPELALAGPATGAQAYRAYMAAAGPLIQSCGAEVVFSGEAGPTLIGPADEAWDLVLLVRYPSGADFLAFTSSEAYLAVKGHRTAALADSRLVPMAG